MRDRLFNPPRIWLVAELIVLYVGLPVLVFLLRYQLARFVVPILVLTGAGLFLLLWKDPSFDRSQLWNTGDWSAHVRRILVRFGAGAAVLAAVLALWRPDLFFSFLIEQPRTWAVVVMIYPAFSVYPQEVIFRTFVFHRYRALFENDRTLIAVSTVGFGLAHLLFLNWVAMALSFAGGYLFARTYARTRSTLMVGIEHALWGIYLFTIGLGAYFYGGTILAT